MNQVSIPAKEDVVRWMKEELGTEIARVISEFVRQSLEQQQPLTPTSVDLNTPIEKLALQPKVIRILQIVGIVTVGDLIQRNQADLLRFRNFGKSSLRQVEWVLAMHGLKLETTGAQ